MKKLPTPGPLTYNRRGHQIGSREPLRVETVNRIVLLILATAFGIVAWLLY